MSRDERVLLVDGKDGVRQIHGANGRKMRELREKLHGRRRGAGSGELHGVGIEPLPADAETVAHFAVRKLRAERFHRARLRTVVHGERAEVFEKPEILPVVRQILKRERLRAALVRLVVEIHGIEHAAAGVLGAEFVERLGGKLVLTHIQLRESGAPVERGEIGEPRAAQIEHRCVYRDELLPEPDIPAREDDPRRGGEHDERRRADDQHAGDDFRFVVLFFLHRKSSGNQ